MISSAQIDYYTFNLGAADFKVLETKCYFFTERDRKSI